jgi:hypothetical protein
VERERVLSRIDLNVLDYALSLLQGDPRRTSADLSKLLRITPVFEIGLGDCSDKIVARR